MNLSSTPPTWLKGHRRARKAWRKCVLYEDQIAKRDFQILNGYLEAVDKMVFVSTQAEEVGRKMDLLVHRSTTFHSKAGLTSDLKTGLRGAQRVNDTSHQLHQLFIAFVQELLRSVDSTTPELRSLILAIVPIGRSLRNGMSSSRSITIKKEM